MRGNGSVRVGVVMVVTALVLLVGEARAVAGQACLPADQIAPCTCKEKSRGSSIVCEEVDALSIAPALDVLKGTASIYRLMLRNGDFPRIQDYLFLGLNVQHLTMTRSNISVVEESSLRTLAASLETLDLSYNNLHTVPSAALEHLQSLSFLNLNYNMIKILGQATFSGLRSLERLSIYDNQMQHVEEKAFEGTGDKLFRLNLGKNHLENIPNLHVLSKLQVLDLSENHISAIKLGNFGGLEKLDILMLENNNIKELNANIFSELRSLNSLNIKHNIISNISEHAFAGLEDNLEWLELAHNRLSHVPSHALKSLHNIRQLDLDSNKIVDIPEDAFEGFGDSIKFLMLSRNNIKDIEPMTFFNLHSLEWLKLSHNELTELPEETVQPILDTLTMIDVSNNPLACTCDLMWLRSWLRNFARRETYKSFAQHICVTANTRTVDVMELKFEKLGCAEYVAMKAGSSEAPRMVAWVVLLPLLLSFMVL